MKAYKYLFGAALFGASVAAAYSYYASSNAPYAPTPEATARYEAMPIKRCMNMSSMEAPNEGDWYGYTLRKQDFKRVSDAGFDTVRLPIRISDHTEKTPPYMIDQDFLGRIEDVMFWALEYDLQIIIDVHHYLELNEDADAHEPRLEAIWDQLAAHFSTAPRHVIFELINEPYGDMTVKRTDALNRRLLKRIRQDNPYRWVIAGSAEWGTLHGLVKSKPPEDPRLISTFHYYSPFEYTHQGAEWSEPPLPMGPSWGTDKDKAAITKEFTRVKKWADKKNIPLLLGEFGVIRHLPPEKRAEWTQYVRETAEAQKMGWCYWDMMGEFKAWDRDVENWIMPIKDALIPAQ